MTEFIDEVKGERVRVKIEYYDRGEWREYIGTEYSAKRAREVISEAISKGLVRYSKYRIRKVRIECA